MYCSDARHTQALANSTAPIQTSYQLDVVEANALAHTPWLTEGDMD